MTAEKNWQSKTVDLSSDESIAYWCEVLQCSKRSLVKAVSQIGTSPTSVDTFLQLNRLKIENKK